MKLIFGTIIYYFRSYTKFNIILLLISTIITCHKIFFLGSGDSLFSHKDITFSKFIFIVIFTVFMLGLFWRILLILIESFTSDILQMIPEIRKNTLYLCALILSISFGWAIFIIGAGDINILIHFSILNLWIVSLFLTIVSKALVPIYRTRKLWILKWIFVLFSIIIPIITAKGPSRHPRLYIFLISTFLIVLLYQLINFIRNYINFRTDLISNHKTPGSKIDKLQDMIENFYTRRSMKTIDKLKTGQYSKRSTSLVHIALFGNEYLFLWLFIGLITGTVYVHFIKEFSPLPLFVGIMLYFGLVSLQVTYMVFRQKFKIEFLYTSLCLTRNDFEKLLLKTVIKCHLSRSYKTLIAILTAVVINNIFLDAVSFIPLIIYIASVYLMQIIVIYMYWYNIISRRDYALIKQVNVIKYIS